MSGGIYTTDKSKTLESLADTLLEDVLDKQAPVYDSSLELFVNKHVATSTGPITANSGDVIIGDGAGGITSTDILFVDTVNRRVGVNNTNPQEDFDVDGNIRINTSATGRLIFYDNNDDHEHGEVDGDDDGTQGGQLVFKVKPDAPGASPVTAMVIRQDGDVGIANTSPNGLLHIGNSNPTGTETNPAIQVGGETTYRFGVYTTTEGAVIHNKNGDDGLSFKVKSVVGDAVRITKTGDVGIGTESPAHRLDVREDSIGVQPMLVLTNNDLTTDNGVALQFAGYRTGDIPVNYATITAKYTNHTTPKSELQFYHYNDAGLEYQALTLDHDSNFGIGTTSPDIRLHVNSGSINECARFESTDTEVTTEFKDTTGTASIKCRNDFRFNNSTNGEVMRIANSGFVGIGQNSPNDLLHITSTTNDARIVVQGATGFDAEVKFFEGLNAKNTIGWDSNSSQFRIGTANVDTNVSFVINSSRNIGIGTTDPTARLDVRGGSGAGTHTHAVFTGTTNRGLAIRTGQTGGQHNGKAILDAQDTEVAGASMDFQIGGSTKMEIDNNGYVGIGMSPASVQLDIDSTLQNVLRLDTTSADGPLQIFRNSGTERGYIGNANGLMNGGVTNFGIRAQNELLFATNGGNERMRITNSGDIEFRSGATVVGEISVLASERISLHTGTVGIEFNPSNQVNPSDGTGGLDNTLDLGAPGARWDDIYATNNVIQTSDKNEKTEIQTLDVKELNVAKKAKTLLRKFKWIDSVNKKGKDARIHFGIIAQDLEKAFTDEGLDAGRYGMFIKSTYTDKAGVKQTRLGIRYNELLAFIISAI